MKNKSNNITFRLTNFGPINKGEITLKPLTILVGENNSGKSYTAMLIYSLMKSFEHWIFMSDLRNPELGPFSKSLMKNEDLLKDSGNLQKELEKFYKTLLKKRFCKVPRSLFYEMIFPFIQYFFNVQFQEEIIYSYACAPNQLIRKGSKNFSVDINFGSYFIKIKTKNKKLFLRELAIKNLSITFKLINGMRRTSKIKKLDNNKYLIEVDERITKIMKSEEIVDYILLDCMTRVISDYMSNNISGFVTYLPSARSGIIQGHKLLTSAIIKRTPYIGMGGKLEIPKFSGIIADFIDHLINIEPKNRGNFYNLTKEFEKEIIKGEIKLKLNGEKSYPEILYNKFSTNFPLYRTSSSVSELAPVLLYLKHIIKPNTTLIIEEPEAHLHPGNQIIFVKYLVKLIRKGVNIIITTHSDFILEKFSNYVLQSQLENKFDKELFLEINEVGVYLFSEDKGGKGYNISKIKVTNDEGIPQTSLNQVIDTLYKETISIKKELENKSIKS